jgi:hypothetical protein
MNDPVQVFSLGVLVGSLINAFGALALAFSSRRSPNGLAAQIVRWKRRFYRRLLRNAGTGNAPVDWREILERPAPPRPDA